MGIPSVRIKFKNIAVASSQSDEDDGHSDHRGGAGGAVVTERKVEVRPPSSCSTTMILPPWTLLSWFWRRILAKTGMRPQTSC